jgi:sodium/potassium-transporting ATPase subunit alpha
MPARHLPCDLRIAVQIVATSDSIHRLDADAAIRSLQSSWQGLASVDAKVRADEFGPNALARTRGRSAAAQLLAQFTHFFAVILWAAAGLATLAERRNPGSGMATLAEAIVAVILVNGIFSFWQERRAYYALEALQQLLPSTVRVRRDGIIAQLPAIALVPGDVIALAAGDQVPADCRVIEAFDMHVDNATLTGESVPQGRDALPDFDAAHETRAQQRNMMLAATSVVAGEGLALVVTTGMRTEFGRIAPLTQAAPDRVAPLQREVAALSRLIALVSVLLGGALFVLGRAINLPFWDNFVFAIGVIVANVPEGLLPTLTLSMAMGAQRMAMRHTLVRHLPAVEALGSATVICTDKTGTLTQNRMRAQQLVIAGESIDVDQVVAQAEAAARYRRLFAIAINAESTRIGREGQIWATRWKWRSSRWGDVHRPIRRRSASTSYPSQPSACACRRSIVTVRGLCFMRKARCKPFCRDARWLTRTRARRHWAMHGAGAISMLSRKWDAMGCACSRLRTAKSQRSLRENTWKNR